MTPEADLAEFCAGLDWAAVPQPVRERVECLLLDALACALTGRSAPPRPAWEQTCRSVHGPGDAMVIAGEPMAPAGSVLLNAFQITATTMCDVYRPALCHITPEVVPGVLAVRQGSGVRLLAALAVGLEVTARLCRSLDYRAFRASGWHAPGVIGPFGAAAAVGTMLGLDATGLRSAWGLALGQASGTFAAIGTLGVKFHQAHGALSGYLAASFAAHGIGGTDRAFTHEDGGLFAAFGGGRPDLLTDGLGDEWELMAISMRQWPAASSLQTVVACVLDMLSEVDVHEVDALTVYLPPASFQLCADKGWHDQGTALQSARWVSSVVLHDGECWLPQFQPERLADSVVSAFASDQVWIVAAPDLSGAAARVVAHLKTGHTVETVHHSAPGDPDRPLSRIDVNDKLQRAAAFEGDKDRARRVIDLLGRPDWSVPELCAALAGG